MRRSCKILLVSMMALYVIGVSAPLFAYMSEADYRQEIKEEVLIPCFSTIMQKTGLAGQMTVNEFLLILKSQGNTVQRAEEKLLQQIIGKPRNVREILYRVGLSACLNGSGE